MLELTETGLVTDHGQARATLDALSALGVRLTLDDFGTGYATLAMLRAYPLHTVKLDESIVRDMTHDRSAAAIVRAALSIAADLGLDVIVEGVESAQMAQLLAGLGFRRQQGYHYSEPLPAAAFGSWLADTDRRLSASARCSG